MQIEPEEIVHLVNEVNRHAEEGREISFELQAFILFQKYGKSDRPFVILERLQCLLAIMDDDRMRGWTIESKDNPRCLMTNEVVFNATARAPIHFVDDRVHFDRDEFFKIALAESPSQGTN
jgi:hypothetical protein